MRPAMKLSEGQRTSLLIGFYDISRFAAFSRSKPPEKIFSLMKELAEITSVEISDAGGIIIKYIGDAALFIFPENGIKQGLAAVVRLKAEAERLLEQHEYQTSLTCTLHFGEVVVGKLPPFDTWDIMGEAVNIAASLDRSGHKGRIIMTPQAFRKLEPVDRKAFHKYTPPVVYVGD